MWVQDGPCGKGAQLGWGLSGIQEQPLGTQRGSPLQSMPWGSVLDILCNIPGPSLLSTRMEYSRCTRAEILAFTNSLATELRLTNSELYSYRAMSKWHKPRQCKVMMQPIKSGVSGGRGETHSGHRALAPKQGCNQEHGRCGWQNQSALGRCSGGSSKVKELLHEPACPLLGPDPKNAGVQTKTTDSQQHSSQSSNSGNNPSVHPRVSG